MADVARHANVSTAAVSYLLSGGEASEKRVGSEARQRILEAVAELSYVQNRAARQLRRRQADRIALVLPLLGVPYSDRIAQDVQMAATARGFSTVVAAGEDYRAVERIFLEIEGGLADGVIADLQHLAAEELEILARRLALANVPMLIFHPTVLPARFSVLRQDVATPIGEALDYLYGLGHRRIAYMLHGALGEKSRVTAYLDFLRRKDLAFDQALMLDGALSRKSAHEATLKLLDIVPLPTALLAELDFAAITAINTLSRAGVGVPGDVAVIGCGNIDEGQFSNPRLTTIGPREPRFSHLAQHVADMISQKSEAEFEVFTLDWSMIRRDSA